MADPTQTRLATLGADGNIDLEDLKLALDAALADGLISSAEAAILRAGVTATNGEPAARAYLDAILAGKQPALPNRVLLAPAPRGAQRDLYYSRFDVVKLQEALGALGYATTVDGDYGSGTSASVRAAQTALGIAATGIVDTTTLVALNAALEAKGAPLLDFSPRALIRPDEVLALRNGANRTDNRAIQAGLAKLGAAFGVAAMQITADGAFGAGTEAAVREFQSRAYLPQNGIVDRVTLSALNAALAAIGEPAVTVSAAPGSPGFGGGVELHFYPGDAERKVYVIRSGRLLESYAMMGGEATTRDDPNSDVNYDPTPKGSYVVTEVSPHTAGSWAWSYVPYGAPLRETDGEVQYQDNRGRWHWATGPNGEFAGRTPTPLPKEYYHGSDGKLLPRWQSNDFGHLRALLKSATTGAIQSHMIHSSPFNEQTAGYFVDTDPLSDPAQALSILHFSHGCEHVHPKDLDEMFSKGYLAPGTRFVVHGYDERYTG